MISKDLWGCYLDETDSEQLINSKKTSRNQLPRVYRYLSASGLLSDGSTIFDLGCGRFSGVARSYVESLGGLYFGVDLYNLAAAENLSAIHRSLVEKRDVAVLSNVLNVVKEKTVRLRLLMQAKSVLGEFGVLVIAIYEGDPRIKDKSSGVVTRDGWQNQWKIEKYIPEVKEIFPEVSVLSGQGGRFIVARVKPKT